VKLNAARQIWQNLTPENPTTHASGASLETKCCHALETRDKDLLVVQDLEVKLGVIVRWLPAHAEWKATAILVGKCRYQRCLDDLEGLIVSRMFELTKMNMSQTGVYFFYSLLFANSCTCSVGYKLRKHIATALRARSQAICNALERYNAAAASVSPLAQICLGMTWSNTCSD
jgi:hypothetical protein